MKNFDAEALLIAEYVQWKAAKDYAAKDTTPEEFMRDRVRQEAYERLVQTIEYIDGGGQAMTDVLAILEGTYEPTTQPEPETDGGGTDLGQNIFPDDAPEIPGIGTGTDY